MVLLCIACEPPASERAANVPAPTVVATAQGRTVHNPGAAERFLPRAGVPDRPIFLFSGVLAAARDAQGRQAVLPPAGDRLLLFDARGRFTGSRGEGTFARAIAITRGPADWLAVERDGAVYSIGDDVTPGQFRLPFELATLVRFQDGFVAARSAFASGGTPDLRGAPLLVEVSSGGALTATIDTIASLDDPTLTTIANSGHLASSDSLFFFAPLTRDEIRAYDGAGRPRWTATRAMMWPRPPAFVGQHRLFYRPVNLAITTHGRFVYTLAYADSGGETMRIDAFDGMTGVLARTATFPAATMLITLDEKGTLWHAPADTLNVIAAPPGTIVVDFALPTFAGDTLRLRSLRGRVVLLNIWASWCGPCRDEFPLMAELSRDLPAEDFAVVAVSDDVREKDARRFLADFNPPFATAWARGTLQRSLPYNGLPFTVLLDREGRVLHRYIGFGGPVQFERLRGDIARALMLAPARPAPRD